MDRIIFNKTFITINEEPQDYRRFIKNKKSKYIKINKIKSMLSLLDSKSKSKKKSIQDEFKYTEESIVRNTNEKIELLIQHQNDLIERSKNQQKDCLAKLDEVQKTKCKTDIRFNTNIKSILSKELTKTESLIRKKLREVEQVNYKFEFKPNNTIFNSNTNDLIGKMTRKDTKKTNTTKRSNPEPIKTK